MKIVTGPAAIQGTREWLDWRSTKRTASNAYSACCGTVAEKRDLAAKLKGDKETYKTAAMQHGNDSEPAARALANDYFGTVFSPVVMESGLYGASLDGMADNGHMIEIKCPYSPASKILEAARAGEIPESIRYQMCQQYAIASAAEAHLVVHYQDEFYAIPFQFDPVMWDEIRIGWDQFWQEYMIGDAGSRDDAEFARLAEEFIAADKEATAWAGKRETARKAILEICKSPTVGCGIQVIKSDRKGAIAWETGLKELGIDTTQFERFRGETSTTWTVKAAKPAVPTP
jgi:putative phage-type endonuclease